MKKGQIGLTQIVGIGVTLALAVGGVLWSKIGMTDNKTSELEVKQGKTNERVATVEEAIRTIKEDNAEIKKDVKTLLQRVK